MLLKQIIFSIIISIMILGKNYCYAKPISNRIGLIEALSDKIEHSANLQAVINSNISQANIPKARAKTLKAFDLRNLQQLKNQQKFQLAKTNKRHLGNRQSFAFKAINDRQANEITPVGNNIVLNDQLKNASDNNIEFTEFSKLLRSSYNILKLATAAK